MMMHRFVICCVAFSLCAVETPAQVTLDALGRDGYGRVSIQQPKPNTLVASLRSMG